MTNEEAKEILMYTKCLKCYEQGLECSKRDCETWVSLIMLKKYDMIKLFIDRCYNRLEYLDTWYDPTEYIPYLLTEWRLKANEEQKKETDSSTAESKEGIPKDTKE